MKMTPCECEQAGWCRRHGCAKTPLLVELCQRLPLWFAAWEGGSGPGQGDARVGREAGQACRHRGLARRTAVCPTCRGHVELHVFACAVHGECTLGKILADLACCARCGDFETASSFHGD